MEIDVRQALADHKGIFLDRGCLFISTSGAFLSGYVNCEVLFPHYEIMDSVVRELIQPFIELEVECFASPSTGDIVLTQYATNQTNRLGIKTTAVWADKQKNGGYQIARNGFAAAIRGRRTLILNDRISTGDTTRKMIDEATDKGGEVIGVATIAGVSMLTNELLHTPRYHALCNIDVESHKRNDMPESWKTVPVAVDEPLGEGNAFMAENPHWPGGFVTLL